MDVLLESFMELGGELWACEPCLNNRQISPDGLIEETKVVRAGTLAAALVDSDAQLSY